MTTNLQNLQVSAYIATSLDGFIATPDHGLTWLNLVKTEGEDYGYAEFMASVDAIVLGRNTYDVIRDFSGWPFEGKKVAVLTHRPLEPLRDEFAVEGPLQPVLKTLENRGVRKVYLDGGQVIQAGLEEGVLSELTLSIIPILLGDGIPLFGKLSTQIRLRQRKVQTFQSGLVQLQYEIT